MDGAVRMRAEGDGAVLSTPYHNGFYVNPTARAILERCKARTSLAALLSSVGPERDGVLAFLARALTLGVVHAYEA
jgi:hypothetical protein